MKKLIELPICQLSNIADLSHFTGLLDDDDDDTKYFSDASIYEYNEENGYEIDELCGEFCNIQTGKLVIQADIDTSRSLQRNQNVLKKQTVAHSTEESPQWRESQSTSSDDIKDEWDKQVCLDILPKRKRRMGAVQCEPDIDLLDMGSKRRKGLCRAAGVVGLVAVMKGRLNREGTEMKHSIQEISTLALAHGNMDVSGIPKLTKQRSLKHKDLKHEHGLQWIRISKELKLHQGHRIKYVEDSTSSSTQNHPDFLNEQTHVPQDASARVAKELSTSLETVHSVVENHIHAAEQDADNSVVGEEVSSGLIEGEGKKNLMNCEIGIKKKDLEHDDAWVLCDICRKWRCIPSVLAEHIEATNCGWSCKENPNKNFADCSVPQEKSNSEINAELDLDFSDHSTCEEGDGKYRAVDSRKPGTVWTLIKHNVFHHRRRKSETIDEQSVCNCMPPHDGGMGCGDHCLNHVMNVECIAQTCPCGTRCSNQQFQKMRYSKVGLVRCGKKGFGLHVQEDVPMGTFIIEYVGEVLDIIAYEIRQKEYALRGQKHYYFMTLNNNEVIDACSKGNLGRFINHSCEPNCRTEKWVVNGEVCIGIFAIRDLKMGEEITFDYNFVRVYGAAAKKCLCGSRECRGFIGGDPMTPPSIVDNDYSEDDPEPVMVEEKAEEESCMDSSKKQVEEAKVDTSMEQSDIGKDTEEKVELDELVDENGGLCKVQSDAQKTAAKYLKLLYHAFISKGAFESKGEALRRTRDVSVVLDALLKTQSRAILMGIVNEDGLKKLNEYMIMSRKDYRETPIVRKLLKVIEFLAVRRTVTHEQINADLGPHSLADTIMHLCHHADNEVKQIAHRLKKNLLNQNLPYRLSRRTNEDDNRRGKQSCEWVQPSQEMLDAVVASGLPQIFWPFCANSLHPPNHHNTTNHDVRVHESDTADADKLAATYPEAHSFPDLHLQGIDPSGVVQGIPVEQLISGSSTGYIPHDGSVCMGIPVAQIHVDHTSVQEYSYFPQAFPFACTTWGTVPFISSEAAGLKENMVSGNESGAPSDRATNISDIEFGISPSKFFKQMHALFAPRIHPWQLQALMAAHAWGPYVSGDARIRDFKEVGPKYCAPVFNETGMASEPPGYDLELEPAVQCLSSRIIPLPHLRRPYFDKDQSMKPNMRHQQHHESGSIRGHKWKPPVPFQGNGTSRWSKPHGYRSRNDTGFRRNFPFNRKNNRQESFRQGSLQPYNNRNGIYHRLRINFNDYKSGLERKQEEPMGACVDGGASCFDGYSDSVHGLEKPMALERSWDYAQEEQFVEVDYSRCNSDSFS